MKATIMSAAALVVSIVALVVAAAPEDAATQREPERASAEEQGDETADDATPEPAPASKVEALGEIPGDGMLLVPDEVKPGTYRSTGNNGCSLEVLTALDGDGDSIRTGEYADGSVLVQVLPGDKAVQTEGCEPFLPVK